MHSYTPFTKKCIAVILPHLFLHFKSATTKIIHFNSYQQCTQMYPMIDMIKIGATQTTIQQTHATLAVSML